MTQPARNPSPLRGLLFGLALMVILFPPVRHMVFNSVAAFLGAIAGAFIAVSIYAVATARR